MSTNENSNTRKPSSNSVKPATSAAPKLADKLSESEAKAWTSKRTAILADLRPQIAALSPEKLQELASQRVARILDEKHNSAESKRDVIAGKSIVTLEKLLESNRLSADSKKTAKENFLAVLTSGRLSPEQMKRANEIFLDGSIKDMREFVNSL